MKFIYSFLIAFGSVFGFAPEAKAATTVTTVVHKVCTVEKQYRPARYNRHGHYIHAHYKNVTVCRNVPRTVIRKTYNHHHVHRHNHRRGVRFTIKL
jgi:hypothetical protein